MRFKSIRNYLSLFLILLITVLFISGVQPDTYDRNNSTDSDYDYPILGSGFSGVADPSSAFSFIDNPALAAISYDNDLSLFFAGFTNFFDIGAVYTTETLYGNLSFYVNYMYSQTAAGSYIYTKTNFSKLINENFWAGISLNIYSEDLTKWGFNFDIGLARIASHTDFEGFSVKNFNWGVVLNNLGLPIVAKDGSTIQSIGISGGISFDFFQWGNKIVISTMQDLDIYFYQLGIVYAPALKINLFNFANIYGGV